MIRRLPLRRGGCRNLWNRCSRVARGVAFREVRGVAALLVGVVLLSGCKPPDERIVEQEPPPPMTQTPARPPRPPAQSAEPRRIVLGKSVEGRSLELIELGPGGDVVFIMASIHGDEPAGTPLVRRLAEHLARNPALLKGRRVLILPVANPDGLHHKTRGNARGVDLNRNFPSGNYRAGGGRGPTALSEPESVAIHKVLKEYRPKRIISLHQPIRYGSACVDYDGPTADLARIMSEHSGLPMMRLGGREGSLGSYAGTTLGIPIITVELPPAATQWSESTLWARYGRMMVAAVRYPERPTLAAGDAVDDEPIEAGRN